MSLPVCSCCDRIYENGVKRPDRTAEYLWTTPNGYEAPLCAACCAYWRANAVEDPELMPQRVESIR